jgi:hypothetical protein
MQAEDLLLKMMDFADRNTLTSSKPPSQPLSRADSPAGGSGAGSGASASPAPPSGSSHTGTSALLQSDLVGPDVSSAGGNACGKQDHESRSVVQDYGPVPDEPAGTFHTMLSCSCSCFSLVSRRVLIVITLCLFQILAKEVSKCPSNSPMARRSREGT